MFAELSPQVAQLMNRSAKLLDEGSAVLSQRREGEGL
jgi:hypothetical protein